MANGFEIVYDAVEAGVRKYRLQQAVETYTRFSCESMASRSDGRPPSDHDDRVLAYKHAAAQYGESLRRDAEAFEQVGFALMGSDSKIAWGLLGF